MIRVLFFFLMSFFTSPIWSQNVVDQYGAIIRSDTNQQSIYLCFTGHDYFEGFEHVLKVLKKKDIKASFFLTGEFIRNNRSIVKTIDKDLHYIGAHSDQHLLYCDWTNRDSLLVSKELIEIDILNNLKELEKLSIESAYFMPPYEWYNQEVVDIANTIGQITVNFSAGTRTNADYTTPSMKNYISSQEIYQSIFDYEKRVGMNGYHMLIHPGTSSDRKDKFYLHLEKLIDELRNLGYDFERF